MIAIHKDGGGFTNYWIEYCQLKGYEYILVDCFNNSIIQLADSFDILLWHFSHYRISDRNFAKEILFSLEKMGKGIFPNSNTCIHFDDKVFQKYLLEAYSIPMVPTYVFHSKSEAQNWMMEIEFPIVFKLKGGAGSSNVKLVKDLNQANRLINKSFSTGFRQIDSWNYFKDKWNKRSWAISSIKELIIGLKRIFIQSEYGLKAGNEIDYVYFQKFIDGNTFDHRIIVIGQKAFAIERGVRQNDFRASGSGEINYDHTRFSQEVLRTAFIAAEKLNTQCVAIDFVYENMQPLIVEISYGFSPTGYIDCYGYWDRNLCFHSDKFDPYGWMIEDLLSKSSLE